MKAKGIFAVLLVAAWQSAHAEPVYMPQAVSVLKAGQTEAGVGAQFGYQSSEILNSPGTTYKNRVWQFPIMARYGIKDNLETRLIVPIVQAVDSAEGLGSYRYSDTGLGNIQIGAKWNFLGARIPLAAALDLDLPTANPANNRAALGQRYNAQLEQGFNGHLQLIADSPSVQDMLTGHLQLGYMNTAVYTTTSQTRFNPSELFTFGGSADFNLKRWVENLSVSAELVGNTALNYAQTNGHENGNTKGTVLEIGPAVRYQRGSVRTYAGFLADLGKTSFRAYNYRVNFGVSLLCGGH